MKINDSMESKEIIKEELTQLLEDYYNGSFAQLACDYIRFTEMTRQEVEQVLEEMRKVKGHEAPFIVCNVLPLQYVVRRHP